MNPGDKVRKIIILIICGQKPGYKTGERTGVCQNKISK